jgi:hypothetical protein
MTSTKKAANFRTMLYKEIQIYFHQYRNIGGKLEKSQIDFLTIQIQSCVLYTQIKHYKMLLLAMFISVGTTLFSCQNKNGDKQKISTIEVIKDTLKKQKTVGVLLPAKDSINDINAQQPKIKEIKFIRPKTIICGEVISKKEEQVGNIRQTKPNAKLENKINEDVGEIMKDSSKTVDKNLPDLIIYETIYENPEYPGGLDNFKNYIKENYKFSKITKPIDGKIVATFVIEKDGTLDTVQLIEGIENETFQELVRILSASKKWKPGLQNGKKVRNRYEITLNIKTDSIKKFLSKTKYTSKIESITLKYN